MSEDVPNEAVLNKPSHPVSRPRVTVTERVLHQVPGEQPTAPPASRFYRWLKTETQAVRRVIKVGQEWKHLDLGCLDGAECGMIVIANTVKRLPSKVPTKEEIAELEARIVDVGLMTEHGVEEFAWISPGEDMRLNPKQLSRFVVRCRSGEAKVAYFPIPE